MKQSKDRKGQKRNSKGEQSHRERERQNQAWPPSRAKSQEPITATDLVNDENFALAVGLRIPICLRSSRGSLSVGRFRAISARLDCLPEMDERPVTAPFQND
jgi:hypothetical protein